MAEIFDIQFFEVFSLYLINHSLEWASADETSRKGEKDLTLTCWTEPLKEAYRYKWKLQGNWFLISNWEFRGEEHVKTKKLWWKSWKGRFGVKIIWLPGED